jgi:thiamine biosynthesis lipoprotein
MRAVRQIMGMPISIDIPDGDNQVFAWVFARLRQIDNKFSTYKPDSEVSKYIRNEIDEKASSPELKNIIRACRAAEKKTDGYFSAWAAGSFDPSGYVKGWAIAEAGKIIEKAGHKTYCISAGGDILARSDGEKAWSIGIQDPRDSSKMLDLLSIFGNNNTPAPHQNLSGAVGNRIVEPQVFGAGLSISNGAVATSGSYERGTHIINPKTKKPATELLSVTVTGPDIIWADVLATAIFAMGKNKGTEFIKSQPNYEVLIIGHNS